MKENTDGFSGYAGEGGDGQKRSNGSPTSKINELTGLRVSSQLIKPALLDHGSQASCALVLRSRIPPPPQPNT